MMALQTGLTVGSPALAGVPGSTLSINLHAHGIALGGYDPVATTTRACSRSSTRTRPAPSPRPNIIGRASKTKPTDAFTNATQLNIYGKR
jgi:hypothetical protein